MFNNRKRKSLRVKPLKMIQTRHITSTHLGTGGMFGSRGNKLNRTSSGAEKSKMVGRVRIKPAADCAGALL